MKIKLISFAIISTYLFLFSACSGGQTKPEKDGPVLGKVRVVEEVEVINEETGEIRIITKKYEELAERSTVDRGAESLLTPQRFVTIGDPFVGSYSVGPSNEILMTVYNHVSDRDLDAGKSNGADLWIFKDGKVRLTKTNYLNAFPSYSSQGKYVYFVSSRGKRVIAQFTQHEYIWRMSSNSAGGITRIGTPTYNYQNPIESPDGSKILFSAKEFQENDPYVWYMQKNGSLPTQLKQGEYASWLDNNTILFSAKDEHTGLYSIWTTQSDGSNLTQIISDAEKDCILPKASPNGQYIAYVKQNPKPSKDKGLSIKAELKRWQSRDIHVFHLNDNLSQQITTNHSRDDMPLWSSKGDYLYFRSTRGLKWNIWRLSTKFLNQ